MINNKNKSKLSRVCATPGCDHSIGDGSITGLCKVCYSSIYNWCKRPQRDVLKRAQNLSLYESRLNFIMQSNKIKIIRPKKQFIPLAVMPGQVKKYKTKSKYKVASKPNRIIKIA